MAKEYIEKWPVVDMLIGLENEFQQYKPFHGFEHAMYRKLCAAEIAIGKAAAADVAPVVHAKWEFIGDDYANCTNCGRVFDTKPAPYFFQMNNPFCRKCGARMDGE